MASRAGFSATFVRVFALMIAMIVLAGFVVYSAGAVTVYVHEKKADGHRILLPVPALLVSFGLRFVPDQDLRKASAELRPWLPAIKAASEELARCPDGPLVEVVNPTERVLIFKRGESLMIDVDSETDAVHLSMPVKLVTSVVGRLETARAPI